MGNGADVDVHHASLRRARSSIGCCGASAAPPMSYVLVLMWALLAAASSAADIQQVACLQDGTIVGRDAQLMLRSWGDGTWGGAEGTAEVSDFWTSSTGQVYARETGPKIVLLKPGMSRQQVNLPAMRASSLAFGTGAAGGVTVASIDEMFQLKADGTASSIGQPPRVEATSDFRPSQPPVVFSTANGSVACFPGSPFEIDNGMKGVCLKTGDSPYHYRVDFGRFSDRTRAAPFLCGDVLVSSIGDQTQARALSDGRRVGQTRGPARTGSRCIGDGRILLVGPDRLRFFEGPTLKRSRLERVRGRIRDVAVCPKQLALLRDDSQIVLMASPTN